MTLAATREPLKTDLLYTSKAALYSAPNNAASQL